MTEEDEQDRGKDFSSNMTKEDTHVQTSLSPTFGSLLSSSVSPLRSPFSTSSSSSSLSSTSSQSKRRRRRPLLTVKEELRVRRRKEANESAADREQRLQRKRKTSQALKRKRKETSLLKVKEEEEKPFILGAMSEAWETMAESSSITSNNTPLGKKVGKVLPEKMKKKKKANPNLSNFHRPLTRSMTASASTRLNFFS